MKFSLTRLFIQRPTLVFVICALMLFAGIISTATIIKELFPNVSQPTMTITVQYSGASVTEMRDEVVIPIEENLAGTPDLQTINSVVQQGQATISAVFDMASSQAVDLALTNKAVQGAQKQLPSGITPPVVNLRDPTQTVVVGLALYSKKLTLGEMSLYVQNVIAPRLEQVPGIAFATESGIVTPAYEVRVDPMKLAAYNLSLTDVINTIASNNNRVPGGYAYQPKLLSSVDVRGDITSLNTVRNLPVIPATTPPSSSETAGQTYGFTGGLSSLPGTVDPWAASNAVPRISDVATVSDGNEPQLDFARINGQRGLIIDLQKDSNASEVNASEAVLQALPLIEKQFPQIQFRVINVQAKFTKEQLTIVERTLLEAVFLTGMTMLFFLRSWRSAIVVCVAIPLSLAIAITIMKTMGMSLDIVSMLGMSVVIGILVDDATVVLENIERHHTELKQSPEDAAVAGREEIGSAAIVITMVDVVVFLPIALIPGQVGRNLNEFAVVVVIATLTSLFVSFTVTPTLAGLWALESPWKPWKIIDKFGEKFDDLRSWYAHRVLPWALRHGKIIAAFCVVTFVGSMALVPLGAVGESYIPPVDMGQIFIQATFPLGTPIDTVRSESYKLERAVINAAGSDEDHETTTVGDYSPSFGGFVTQPNVTQIHVFLVGKSKHPTDYWVRQFQSVAAATLPKNVQSFVVPTTSIQGGNSQPIDFIVSDLSGGDPTPYARRVYQALLTVPGATSVNSTAAALMPQISVVFERRKAQALGVDIGTAAQAAGAAFGGNQATEFVTSSGFKYVQVIYPLADQTNLAMLRNVPIRAQNGNIVYLGDIASLQYTPSPPLITRTNRYNVVHVDANYAPNSSLSAVENGLMKKLPSLHLPSAIVVRPAPLGQQYFMHQTLVAMGASMIISILLVYLLMVALYNSYLSPFIIIFSVPVAAVGAITALLVTHNTLNLFSLIGTILLVGIATKNGILIVDYANTLRDRGLTKYAAIKESALTRFRPIIMTSLSVIAGNIPLALALDPGSGNRTSLGIVIIGGAISSLVLTLLLIPNVYLWVSPADAKLKKGKVRTGDAVAGRAPAV